MNLTRPLIAALLLISAVACTKAPPAYESRYTEPPEQQKPIAVTVVGDSFTSGTEQGGQGDKGWPKLATQKLQAEGVNVAVAVAAAPGAGWAEPNSQSVMFSTEMTGKMSEDTALVVLFGSLNDGSVAPEVLGPMVGTTLSDVKEDAPNAKVLVIGPPTLGKGTASDTSNITAVRDTIQANASSFGAVFVDPIAENWFSDPAWIGVDGIHPTDAGHQMMADRIAPLIAEQLTTSPPQP